MKRERMIEILAEESHMPKEFIVNSGCLVLSGQALTAMQRVAEEETTRLRECEAIVRSLGNVGHLAYPQHNPHIIDIIDTAHQWVKNNPK